MNLDGKTRELLIKQYQKYPQMQIEDIFKFLYQSTFGCEHMISTPEKVTDYIKEEFDNMNSANQAEVEELDGAFCRVPLSCLNDGLNADTLGKVFFLSAQKKAGGVQELQHKIAIVREMLTEGLLPYAVDTFNKVADAWELKGYCAIHHSETFRKAYKPAYRVVAKEYAVFLPLLTELDKRLSAGALKVAIEGGSASGKSTLGELLTMLYECTLFHMDDFFLQPKQRTCERLAEPGGNVDWERFRKEVLIPLHKGEKIYYRKFDCGSMELMDEVEILPQKLVVTEGAYAMHPMLADYYDFTVFLDVLPHIQKQRIIKRNDPQFAKRFFEEWIPMEETYFTHMNIKEKCDMKIAIT